MKNISLVVIAFNEERHLADVLSSAAAIVDEIIVVDSGSSDSTVPIAKSFGAKVVHQNWLGYSGQKNFALDLATCEWVLSLDADEILTPDLVAEIKELKTNSRLDEFAGYKIPRILYIGDKPVRHGGFYPDAQLRLFARGKGRFNERAVHERVFVEGPVGRLRQAMKHYSYPDILSFQQAMDKYARLSSGHYAACGYSPWRISRINELLHPLWTFFYRFVLRGGFLDGMLGLKLNLIYKDYVQKKISYLRAAVNTPPDRL